KIALAAESYSIVISELFDGECAHQFGGRRLLSKLQACAASGQVGYPRRPGSAICGHREPRRQYHWNSGIFASVESCIQRLGEFGHATTPVSACKLERYA